MDSRRRVTLAFFSSIPIGLAGGLIGLGGAEFRLPVLAGPLGFSPHQAVPLNLAISLVTLLVALMSRATTLSLAPLTPFVPAMLALMTGAVVAAFLGVNLLRRLSEERLTRVLFFLLVGIGVALILEGFLPQNLPGFLPPALAWRLSAGLLFGLGIGFVSSLLGVAGGELIIPTLVFAFGADIKTAGTASLFISAPTVLVGVLRYASRGAYTERRLLLETALPMSVGSFLGAMAGGLLVGVIPVGILKIFLGFILNGSAFHIFHRSQALKRTSEAESVPRLSPFSRPEILLATTTSVQDTHMLASVLPLFEKDSGYQVRTLAVGTGQALALARQSEADLVFTHAPEAEKSALRAGTVVNRRLVMHNTFLLAGPAADPAKTRGSLTISEALAKIAQAHALFVSRGDDSGTHLCEKQLWEQAGITPADPWYLTTRQGMGSTLEVAGRKEAYVLTDKATYLAFQQRVGLVIVFESDSELVNPYHVMEVNPTKRPGGNPVGGKALADFFLSATVQKLLSTFGSERFGMPLFSPACGRTEDTLRSSVSE